MLLGYCILNKKKEKNFLLLFSAIFIINLGYALGSAAVTLEEALVANRISYAGSVFLPLFMLIIIMDECRYDCRKVFLSVLMCISGAIFFLTMTPGYTPWYYKSVGIEFVNGGAKLVKTYGPLHKLYFVYLILYFSLMIAVIVWAMVNRKHASSKVPVNLLILVFCNIMVWFIEQKVDLNFEFLAISYIVTEAYLLGLYNMMYREVGENAHIYNEEHTYMDNAGYDDTAAVNMDEIISVCPAAALLTTREAEVLKHLILNEKRKDIAVELCVSENTIKKHTTNIYAKLGVSNRTEIINMLSKTE